ncbi:NAD(P)-dependent oxidoreductase, partial [Klebsiella pneumoniae]
GTAADLPAFLHEADVVVLACPLTEETRGMAGQAFFAGLKQGAILVNIARGGLVDDGALLTALDNGRLSSAILDVFHEEPLPASNPLWGHPGV